MVMAFEKKMSDVNNFADTYWGRSQCQKKCMIKWIEQLLMEAVNEFKHLGFIP